MIDLQYFGVACDQEKPTATIKINGHDCKFTLGDLGPIKALLLEAERDLTARNLAQAIHYCATTDENKFNTLNLLKDFLQTRIQPDDLDQCHKLLNNAIISAQEATKATNQAEQLKIHGGNICATN